MVDEVVILVDVTDHEGRILIDNEMNFKCHTLHSRERRLRSISPIGRDRRRGGSRSRSPYSRSPIARR